MSEKENSGESIQKKFDLQERFIDYAVRIIKISEQLPETKAVGGSNTKKRIRRKRKMRDSDKNTWLLDIPCWILEIHIFYVSLLTHFKIKGIIFFINFFTLPTHLLKEPFVWIYAC